MAAGNGGHKSFFRIDASRVGIRNRDDVWGRRSVHAEAPVKRPSVFARILSTQEPVTRPLPTDFCRMFSHFRKLPCARRICTPLNRNNAQMALLVEALPNACQSHREPRSRIDVFFLNAVRFTRICRSVPHRLVALLCPRACRMRLPPARCAPPLCPPTSRTVIGGLPEHWLLIRRRISTPARRFRLPSSQPPLGTESMWRQSGGRRCTRP